MEEHELMEKIKALDLPEGDERIKSIVCSLIGHSNIVTNCFGYKHCARCDEQVGDSLAGYWSGVNAVIVGHNCETCRENYEKMGWQDKLFVADPFTEDAKDSDVEDVELERPQGINRLNQREPKEEKTCKKWTSI